MTDVTVVMPAYNSSRYIAESIRSVQLQSYTDWELIVVDDASSDNTAELVREFCRIDDRIRLVVLPANSGAAFARNKAIKHANGRFIAFLDSDDLWKRDKLSRQIAFMRLNDIALSFTSYEVANEDGLIIGHRLVNKPVSYDQLLKGCVIGCLTAVYDTNKVGKVFMKDVAKRQDFALWLQILKSIDFAYPLNETLATYRVRAGAMSANKFSAAAHTWAIYRDVEQLSLATSLYCFTHYLASGVKERARWRVSALQGTRSIKTTH